MPIVRPRVLVVCIALLTLAIVPAANAACLGVPNVSITCDAADDIVPVSSALSDFVDGGAGADSITVTAPVGLDSNATSGVIGGVGADTLANASTILGDVGMVDGDRAADDGFADSLANSGFIRSASSGLQGGNGDTLNNSGLIESDFVGLDCLSDALGCSLINSGTINGANLGVLGGGGADTFVNTGGQIINGINLLGGDDSVGLLGGSIDGPITLGFGSDTLVNYARTQNIQLGAGGDSLVNDTTGTIIGNVDGGADNDSIVNGGDLLGSVSLGAGADSFTNTGGPAAGLHAVVSGGVFGGDGSDTITNLQYSAIGGVDAGVGDDSVFNSSLIAGVMGGGDGSDTLVNAPGGLTNYLTGDNGDDSVSNFAAVNTSVQGGIGNDTVINFAGGVASWLDGFSENDLVINGGFVNADLNGGAGNDSVVNLAGAFVSQIYGDAGNDTVVNGGFLLGSARGGADNDIVVNLGGAQATSLLGEVGSDSVFNGGYLVSQISGGDGNDTVVNAAFAFAGGGANLGSGDDQFINGGYLVGGVDCGAGSDTVSVGGRIEGNIICGDGGDIVSIFNGVVAGAGAAVIGTIDGGTGIDGLVFNFTVSVASQAAAQAISAAIAAASPAGGTVTIAGVPYTWTNFEALYDLLQFTFSDDVVISIPVARRINHADAAAPVAVYCAGSGVELWTVNAEGAGSFAVSVPYADVNAGTTVSAAGVTFTSTSGGVFTVSATALDGKAYTYTGTCS